VLAELRVGRLGAIEGTFSRQDSEWKGLKPRNSLGNIYDGTRYCTENEAPVGLTNPQRKSVTLRTLFNFKRIVNTLRYLLHAGFLLGLFFDSEDGGEMFLRNVG
jgi:hypothetical protein